MVVGKEGVRFGHKVTPKLDSAYGGNP